MGWCGKRINGARNHAEFDSYHYAINGWPSFSLTLLYTESSGGIGDVVFVYDMDEGQSFEVRVMEEVLPAIWEKYRFNWRKMPAQKREFLARQHLEDAFSEIADAA